MAGYVPPDFADGDPRFPVDEVRLRRLGEQYAAVAEDAGDPSTPVGAAVREAAAAVVPAVADPVTAGLIGDEDSETRTALNGAFVGVTLSDDTGISVRRKTSATHGTGYVFGTAASFGFAGTGSPTEIAGAFGIYMEYGKASKGSNVTKTTQGGYAVTNYWGPTVDDSAEGFSSAVILKKGPAGFTQSKPTTAFEAIAQVEDTNSVVGPGYTLGVGSRLNVLGSGHVDRGYGFKASVNTSGGPPYGSIDWYAAFAQVEASGATTAYGVYVVDPINSEVAIGVGASGWTGQARIARQGNSDSAVSLMVLKGPDSDGAAASPRGLTELSLVAGANQTRSIFEARDAGGTTRFQIGSAGNLFMRGQQVQVATSGGTPAITLHPTAGMTLADATDIVLGATTGTRIGTGTGQKLGFWGKSPVVRPTLPGAGAVTAADIRDLLIQIGLSA